MKTHQYTVAACVAVVLVIVGALVWRGANRPLSDAERISEIASQVSVPANAEEFVTQSRTATPDLFGDPVQAVATLTDEEAKLAAIIAHGDPETMRLVALFWRMTPDIVAERADAFQRTLKTAEELVDRIEAAGQGGLDDDSVEARQLGLYLSIWGHIIAVSDPQYDDQMPAVGSLCTRIFKMDEIRINPGLAETAAYALWELKLGSWLDPMGQAALDTAIALNPNLPVYLPRWREITVHDFLENSAD